MSLLSYQEVRPWVRAIRQRVSTRQMPPWHIDRSIGEYADDPSLTRRRDRDHRVVDRQRRAAGQPGRRAAAAQVHGARRMGARRARPRRPDGEGLQDPGDRPRFHARRSRRSEDHRRPLREVGADHPDGALLRPPLARLRRAAGRRRPRRPRASAGLEHRRRDRSDRVRGRQRRRHLRRRHREDDQGRLACSASRRTTTRTARKPTTARRSGSSSIRRATSRSTSSPRTASGPASATTGPTTASASRT